MKILFIGSSDKKWGSSRLHVHNLASWLRDLGHQVDVNTAQNTEYEIVVLGKEVALGGALQAKKDHPSALIGKVNPSDLNSEGIEIMKLSDFLIVGSIPEKDHYIEHNANILVIPQIEEIFTKRKAHVQTDKITIGYHGNLHHLEQLNPNITPALERLASEYPIRFVAIYDKESLGEWKTGRPNIETEIVQWNLDTLEDELLKCDIGIVPGLFPISSRMKSFIFKIIDAFTNTQDGLRTDFLTRYKNTTNSGREFVFHQLGIPVVSDFIPTAFHILGNPDNGFLAHTEEGWYQSLKDLCASIELRQKIADNASKEFERLYDPKKWVESEFEKIKKLLIKQ